MLLVNTDYIPGKELEVIGLVRGTMIQCLCERACAIPLIFCAKHKTAFSCVNIFAFGKNSICSFIDLSK